MTWSISIKTVGSLARNNSAPVPSKSTASAVVGSGGSSTSSTSSNDTDSGGVVAVTNPTNAVATNAANDASSSAAAANDGGESNFTIQVDPDDPLHSLHDKIESVTGLKAEQQRLIYRGRIINSGSTQNSPPTPSHNGRSGATEVEASLGDTGVALPQQPSANDDVNVPFDQVATTTTARRNTPRVRDVNGLCDQQTIHLVPRLNATNNTSNSNNSNNSSNSGNSNNNAGIGGLLGGALGDAMGSGSGSGTTNVTSLSGEAGMSLLAALLGVSGAGNGGGSGGGGVEVVSGTGRGGGTAAPGGAEGLGGIVERAVMMGVLDEPTLPATGGVGSTLFSLGSTGDGSPSNDNNNNTTGNNAGRNATAVRNATDRSSETFPRLAPLGNTARRTMSRRNRNQASAAAARARASAARLTEADVRVPDPGGGEPVRQGLMTLHTLLGNALEGERRMDSIMARGVDGHGIDTSAPYSSSVRVPLDSNRRWYRGQWLDALDTVNQWLEATVVDIVVPSDILPDCEFKSNEEGDEEGGEENEDRSTFGRRTRRATPDAVVSANDLEGRRRLLLEPLPENDDDESNNEQSNRRGGGGPGGRSRIFGERYRPRSDNTPSLQLLLIHYNGWPHRWDEWIRSDSERLRPFRTRTRHRSTSLHACPTPTAVFPASPCTAIVREDEGGGVGGGEDGEDHGMERTGMLEELERVVAGVHGLLHTASGAATGAHAGERMGEDDQYALMPESRDASDTSHLPWRALPHPSRRDRTYAAALASPPEGEGDNSTRPDPRSRLDAARLRQLAPLLDRLGRTLVDAAPHVAALADSLPAPSYASLLDLGSNGDSMSNEVSGATSGGAIAGVAAARDEDPVQSLAARASHLYFGIGGDDADDSDGEEENDNNTSTSSTRSSSFLRSTTNRVDPTALNSSAVVVEERTTAIIDPDLTDYVDGMVNTSRGGNGRGNADRDGNRNGGSVSDPIGSSLLASYLSSLGGGGGGGDGIGAGGGNNGNDNHARVIRMGGNGAGGGLGGLGGGLSTAGNGGGPGIDIHIHAIVTGPGMANNAVAVGGGGGGLGGVVMDGGGIGGIVAPRDDDGGSLGINHAAAAFGAPNSNSGNNISEEDDDDIDLFSELYSESPAPVNLHGEDDTRIGIEGISNNHDSSDDIDVDLNLLFEECRSIEEEDSLEGEEVVQPTEAEVILALEDNIPCLEEADDGTIASPSSPPLHHANSDGDAALAMEGELANRNDVDRQSSASINSISSSLVLSEIESQESSTATVSPSPSSDSSTTLATAEAATTTMPITPMAAVTMSPMRMGGGSSISRASSRSPSFGNRLFRRTLGRISGSSSRRSGGSSSTDGSGGRST